LRTWPTKSKSSIPTIAAIVRAHAQKGTSIQQFLRRLAYVSNRRSLPPPSNQATDGAGDHGISY
jgi:hypothetical protein